MKLQPTTFALFVAGLVTGLTLIAPATGADQPATTTTTAPATTSKAADARDPISALSPTSITVGPLTCSIDATSPSVPFKVGNRVRIGCLGGVLVHIAADADFAPTTTATPAPAPPVTTTSTPPPATHDELQTRLGPIATLTTAAITVDGLTCSLGSSSPNLSSFEVSDQVGIACANGVLVKIGALRSVGDDSFKVAVQLGTITSLRVDGITVASLSCKLADSSPSVASFKLGDRVGIGCAGGILFMIGALPDATAAPQGEVKQALVRQLNGCIKRGAERCLAAGVLRRVAHAT